MEDSFFGFDTSVPLDEDSGGGRIAEPSEEEYDALNDETFGSAINGDWEEAHECLVKLTDNCTSEPDDYDDKKIFSSAASSGPSTPVPSNFRGRRTNPMIDSDLELNLSGMKLDDVEIGFDDGDFGSGINLDPGVWASHPFKPTGQPNVDLMRANNAFYAATRNGMMEAHSGGVLRENFSGVFRQQQHHQEPYVHVDLNQGANPAFRYPQQSQAVNVPKICTLEDIERNIIIQQAIQKRDVRKPASLAYQQQKHSQNLSDILKQTNKAPGPGAFHPQQDQQKQPQGQHNQKQSPLIYPPGFLGAPRPSNNFVNNLAQHPLGNISQQQQATGVAGNRLPPGFQVMPPGVAAHVTQQGHPHIPTHPLLNQHVLSNFPHQHQRPLPHLPIALNNLQMHPNFNAMRAAAVVAGLHSASLVPPPQQPPRLPSQLIANTAGVLSNQQPTNPMYNMFSMRLVQEIQQNHPLLQNNTRQAPMNVPPGHPLYHQQQRLNNVKQNYRRDSAIGNGNLPPDEFDDYANLMSTRDKHWLIGIQLSQLNTDTPYIDDYYYTVFRERKAAVHGNVSHSKAHKDNQLNHPLTQPKGHAQLILVQLGNKNGTRNGQHRDREHRNSESGGPSNCGGHESKTPYVFTPLKFENSLGKLQFGSVTAPRKIIDAEIMGGEQMTAVGDLVCKNNYKVDSLGNVSDALNLSTQTSSSAIGDASNNMQRKSRHILLHIETLFRIVLKLEDLDNPNAIATIITKKRKEIERIAALEQMENANKLAEERTTDTCNPQPINPALKNKFAYEIETKDALESKLIQGLTYDKILALMNVRKGKVLIKRIMPYIEDSDIRWNVWIGVFASLQNVIKKDRDDSEGVLYALYPEFKKQIRKAPFTTLVKVADSILINDKKSSGVFCSKFGISSLVCIILRAEHIYLMKSDSTLDDEHKKSWRNFLNQVASALNHTIQNQTICAAIETDSIQPMTNHFARFKDLKLDSLLALITEAKQQIN